MRDGNDRLKYDLQALHTDTYFTVSTHSDFTVFFLDQIRAVDRLQVKVKGLCT